MAPGCQPVDHPARGGGRRPTWTSTHRTRCARARDLVRLRSAVRRGQGSDVSGQVVVVGGGLAGAKTVEGLRERGYDGGIVLLGSETERPYERPPLSKGYLQGS